jgi:hypothetical protein
MSLLRGAVTLCSATLLAGGCGGGSAAQGAGRGPEAAVQQPRCVNSPRFQLCRVLFIGNSYTYTNDLPGMFQLLARAGGRNVESARLASPNETLEEHFADPQTAALLHARAWNVVVLQEKSTIPGDQGQRLRYMVPAARSLAREIRQAGAVPMLFLTWGHLGGEPEASLFNYPQMQAAVDRGYDAESRELHAPVAPVGDAWQVASRGRVGRRLWLPDGSHPTSAGTYLAACVFFASIVGESPVGIRYHGGLPAREARELQAIAARVAG